MTNICHLFVQFVPPQHGTNEQWSTSFCVFLQYAQRTMFVLEKAGQNQCPSHTERKAVRFWCSSVLVRSHKDFGWHSKKWLVDFLDITWPCWSSHCRAQAQQSPWVTFANQSRFAVSPHWVWMMTVAAARWAATICPLSFPQKAGEEKLKIRGELTGMDQWGDVL